jgi:hypothetical protein
MTTPRANLPRWARLVLLAIALGSATTILVAWAFAVFAPSVSTFQSMCPLRDPADHNLYVRVMDEESRGLRWWCIYPSSINNATSSPFEQSAEPGWRLTTDTLAAADRSLTFNFSREIIPMWLPRSINSEEGLIAYGGRAAGWPLLSMRSLGLYESPSSTVDWAWSFRFRDARGPNAAFRRSDPLDGTLPLQPIPLGFAANTALFAAGWWTVLFLPIILARWGRRRRKGGCAQCGYPFIGLAPKAACPECGALTLSHGPN